MFISQAITCRNPSSHCQVPISQDTNEKQILGHLIQPWYRPRASVTCHISNNHSWNLNNHSLGTTGQDTIETQIPLIIDADYQEFFSVVTVNERIIAESWVNHVTRHNSKQVCAFIQPPHGSTVHKLSRNWIVSFSNTHIMSWASHDSTSSWTTAVMT